MDTTLVDDQEEKAVPGTLLESNESAYVHLHEHLSHQHKHGSTHTPPALVEVRSYFLRRRRHVIAFV